MGTKAKPEPKHRLLFGLGGIYVDILSDGSFYIPPNDASVMSVTAVEPS